MLHFDATVSGFRGIRTKLSGVSRVCFLLFPLLQGVLQRRVWVEVWVQESSVRDDAFFCRVAVPSFTSPSGALDPAAATAGGSVAASSTSASVVSRRFLGGSLLTSVDSSDTEGAHDPLVCTDQMLIDVVAQVVRFSTSFGAGFPDLDPPQEDESARIRFSTVRTTQLSQAAHRHG